MGAIVTGGEEALRNMEARAARMSNAVFLMRKLASYYRLSVVPNTFRTTTDPNTGNRWRGLKDSTRRKYLRIYDGNIPGTLLRRNGDLFRSIQTRAGRRQFVCFSGIVYGATHQYGDPTRQVPQRAFLGFGRSTRRTMLNMVASYMMYGVPTGQNTVDSED